jgi:hypothetical protein
MHTLRIKIPAYDEAFGRTERKQSDSPDASEIDALNRGSISMTGFPACFLLFVCLFAMYVILLMPTVLVSKNLRVG